MYDIIGTFILIVIVSAIVFTFILSNTNPKWGRNRFQLALLAENGWEPVMINGKEVIGTREHVSEQREILREDYPESLMCVIDLKYAECKNGKLINKETM